MQYQRFKEHIKEVAEEFKKLDKKEPVRLISHLDADGISACSILIRALNNENRSYAISVVQQVDRELLEELSNEGYNYFIFSDLGSGQINNIRELFKEKKVFIFDHHETESDLKKDKNIFHVNPHLFGIDGTKEISGAGIVYLFARYLDSKNDEMAHIAIIGAVGDIQEENGFLKLNKEILETAEKNGKIEIRKGLRFFGAQTKPLHKILEYSTDPYIPGVTGSETGAIQLLQDAGITPKNGNGWKKLGHLDEDEMRKLVTAIVMRRLGEKKPEDVLGPVYILPNEEEESPLRDVKEFSTLLNACGRLNKASLGIGACLGDEKIKHKAIKNLNEYKKEIICAINWFKDNKSSRNITIKDRFVIINAQDNVLGTMIGTLASIIAKSGEFEDGTFVLSLAYLGKNIKASLRISGNNKNIDLRKIIKEIVEEVGGEAGGHANAAGAVIPKNKEEEFVLTAKKILEKCSLEEKIE